MKKHIIYILICFWVAKIGAQPKNAELGDIQVPAPEVAALGKYIDIPVSSFTGVAPVNIPIHQLQEGPLSVPISLSYHGSGIRAAETASWVGLGWNLNASGVISRTILGTPDDNTNGFLKATHNYTNSNVLQQVATGLIDGEPDLFSFSLPGGGSGKFIINKDIGGVFDIVQFPRTDIRIEVSDSDLEEFTIITTDGTKYFFGQSGNENYDGFTKVERGSPIQRNSPKRQHTEWYLRRIESYDGNYHIDFNYIAKEFGIVSPASQSYSKVYADYNYSSELTPQIFTDANYGDGGVLESLGQFQILGPNNGVTELSLYGNFQGHETKQILSITTSTTIVQFIEGNENEVREDVNSYPYTTSIITDEVGFHDCKPLKQIKIQPQNGNTFCKTFNFNYDYFKSVDDPYYTFDLRLKLNQVQEISCSAAREVVPPYKFDYYKEEGKSYYSVPWRLTKATDAWGYYNGATSNDDEKFNFPLTTLGVSLNNVNLATESKGNANRSTNEDAMKLGALRKITFPEKGYTEFDLEANAVKKEQYDTMIVNRPKSINLPAKISSCSENNADGDCCPDANNSVLYNFTEDYIDKAVFKIYLEDIRATTNQNSMLCNDDVPGVWDGHIDIALTPEGQTAALYPTIELNDNQSDSFLVNLKDHYPNIAPGNYTVSILSAFCRGTLKFMEEEYTDISINEKVGGLRIKEKITYDQNDNLLRSMAYDYENPEDVGFSSGVLYKKPSFGHVVASADQTVIGTGGNVSVYYAKLTFNSSQTVPLTDIQGYHIGYENVKATETNGAFTTYLHKTRSLDEEITTVQPYPLAPLPYFYDNGALLETNQGNFSDTIATNKTIGDQVLKLIAPRNAVRVDLASGQQGSLTLLVPNRFAYQQNGFYRQYQQLSTLDDVTTQTLYEYDGSDRFLSPRSITTTNSDGKTYKREFTYVHHLMESSTIYEEMFNRNIINNPIGIREFVINNGAETQIKGSRTEYSMFNASGSNVGNTLTNANPYPHTYEQYEMTWGANGSPVVNGDGWRVVGTVNSYHTNGKPAEFTRDGWKKESYTWHPVNNLLATRTFEGFNWQYDYHPSTRLVSKITDIDDQDTDYTYDGLMRLSSINERDGNIITDFTYRYTGQDITRPQNYVKTKTTLVPSTGSNYTEKTTYQYFDDIGRMVQTVNQAYSPNQKDVVEAIIYDQFGRATHNYEPFEATTTNGTFANSIPSNTPFTFLDYEDSPLNRVISETPPDWHISYREYGNNTIPITVPDTSITYAAGELSIEKIIDPDGSGTKTGDQTIVYRDKKGQTILSVQQNSSGSEKAETYYVYDDKDRMVMVIPPGATADSTGLIYTYTYDERNRVATSKIPDSEFMEYTYNTRDLQTGMRNGNLRMDGKWMVTEYDDYGRPTKTGLNTSATTVNELWTQTFYDGFDGASTLPGAIYTGKVRKRVAHILNGNTVNTTDKIETSFEYDAFGRVEQQNGNTHLGGTDNYTYTHDYADNMLTENRTLAVSGQASQTINYRYTYDHRGRLDETFHQVTGISEQRLCKFDYTHKDEILSKSLGGSGTNYLQSLNYTYNAQSWLLSINQELSNSNDLFHLKLAYDTPENLMNVDGRFDGNIAQANWQVKGKQERTYGFQYDYLDRLTSSVHGTYQNAARSSLGIDNNYNTTYSYDKRGNIQTLTRDGLYNNGTAWERQQIDDLDYDYYPNSNRISTITDAVSGGADCPPTRTINTPVTQSGMYAASNQIIGSNSVGNTLNVNFQAGNRIELDPGFIVEPITDARFTAQLGDCPTTDSDFGGFVQNGTGVYEYDKNGNLTIDPHKQINIEYNYLNLPYKVTFTDDNSQKVIEWLYDARGTKFQKKVSEGINPILTMDYIAGVEYRNDALEAIYHSEGRVYYENGSGRYEYTLADHLGNNRVTFKDNGSGVAEILQENHFYPFGLAMKGDFLANVNKQNNYLYNGKELDTDFGLNWYHYGFRMYDPAIARFTGVDPISDQFAELSTYNYASNDPVLNIDLHGLQGLSSNTGAAWLAERQNPQKAKGLYQKARNYENASGAGTIVGGAFVAGGAAVSVYGTEAVGGFLLNEAKDEALSQATGGASDIFDITKAGAKLLKSGLDGIKGLNNFSDEGLDAFKGGMKFDNISGGDASSFISTEFDAQSVEKIKTFETALKNGDMSIFSEPIFTTQNAGSTFILDGHHRIQAAINVGAENVPIVRLSPNEAQQLFPNKTQQILDGEFN